MHQINCWRVNGRFFYIYFLYLLWFWCFLLYCGGHAPHVLFINASKFTQQQMRRSDLIGRLSMKALIQSDSQRRLTCSSVLVKLKLFVDVLKMHWIIIFITFILTFLPNVVLLWNRAFPPVFFCVGFFFILCPWLFHCVDNEKWGRRWNKQ